MDSFADEQDLNVLKQDRYTFLSFAMCSPERQIESCGDE